PLAAGLADDLLGAGFPVFGPPKAGAMIEASKRFSKKVMAEAGIPTAAAESFTDAAKAKDFARSLGLPVVIKADGLAAGKGVTVAMTWEEAARAIDENLLDKRFGDSSAEVLVEEFMEGEEASIFGLCDGESVYPLVPAQDHKRVFDGDAGPNTGGMGAYAPAPVVSEEVFAAAFSQVFRPLVQWFKDNGIVYRGVIYAGLMLTADGLRVVEFNCRFGDPETQAVLPLLDGDFGEILLACAEGRLAPMTMAAGPEGQPGILTRPDHAITVVLASGGYPGEFVKGHPISGLETAIQSDQEVVFHAGTAFDDGGRVVTNGGRVLSCTAWDTTLAKARDRAYDLAGRIDFKGRHFRRDIAWRALPTRN
ncbi:MAG: phosphoribosylamine--glycine ligase, partial [Candidatus Sumerlaeia bacterium]|nr:phosphoribosylamine--glycine ligase [Candidatus Sumerlaeia bacterium]